MELHALSTGRKPRVVTAMTMLKQMLFQCVCATSLFASDENDPLSIPIVAQSVHHFSLLVNKL
jgi:hypothetical protein